MSSVSVSPDRHKSRSSGLADLYVSVYGDGALLDASFDSPDYLRRDEEPDEEGNPQPTAILALSGVPRSIAERAMDYVNGNCGTEPYSDGYQAMECVCAAKSIEVLECDVSWSPEECKRLGGCYLCSGFHA